MSTQQSSGLMSKFRPKLLPHKATSSYGLQDDEQRIHRECEARVALVCYGGVSMAIWVAGVTAEILNCITGSRVYEEGFSEAEAEKILSKSALVYYRLFKHIHDSHPRFKLDLRLVVDLIGGTSAGGINGICLATAVTNSLSVSPLKEFWLKEADIEKLRSKDEALDELLPLDPNERTWGRTFGFLFSKGIYKTGAQYVRFKAVNTALKMLPNSLTSSPKVKNFVDLASRAFVASTPVLSGPTMKANMLGGISSMFEAPLFDGASGRDGRPLQCIRPGDSLKLFVPITDHASYRRTVVQPGGFVKDSRLADEENFSHVLRFCHTAHSRDLGPEDLRAMAFAARATSSFPLAFPGIRTEEFFPDAADRRAFERRHFPEYVFASGAAGGGDLLQGKDFVDGGVLLNKPFGPVLDELRKPRTVKHGVVHRSLLYVEPHPNSRAMLPAERELRAKVDLSRFPAEYRPPGVGPAAAREEPAAAAGEDGAYKWAGVVSSVLGASISEPIGEQLRDLIAQNSEIRKVNKMGLRTFNETAGAYLRSMRAKDDAAFEAGGRAALPESVTEERIAQSWTAFWKESEGVFGQFIGPGRPVLRLHCDMRVSDVAQEVARIVCSKPVQSIPSSTVESDWVGKIVLEHVRMNTDLFDDALPVEHDNLERFSVVRCNVWFFRDLFQFLQRAIEAPFFELSELCKPSEIMILNELLPQLRETIRDCVIKLTYFLSDAQLEEVRSLAQRATPREARLGLGEDGHFHASTYVAQHRAPVGELVDTLLEYSKKFVEKHVFHDGGMLSRVAIRAQRLPWLHAHLARVTRAFFTFDSVYFPVIHVTKFGEGEQVSVNRISPDDSQCLFWKTRIAKKHKSFTETFLRCWPMAHFQGFLDAEARENDLLWGRLDGAESIINTILSTVRNDLKEYIHTSNFINHGAGIPPLNTKQAMDELEETVMQTETINQFYQNAFEAIGEEFRETNSELVQYLVSSVTGHNTKEGASTTESSIDLDSIFPKPE